MGKEIRADVCVVGAGPAGAMAGLVLARAGIGVVLVDRAAFPRDKTCGDGLMPDSMAALRSVGLLDSVLEKARRHDTLKIFAPNGTPVSIRGSFAVITRERLDATVCEAAVAAGARLLAPVTVDGPLEEDGRVAGVTGVDASGERIEIRAPLTVLATGSNAVALRDFGVCERTEPSAMAARFYARLDSTGLKSSATTVGALDPGCLCISYDRSICPGYGWLFPGPDATFNIGVGYFQEMRPKHVNLRNLMERFLETFQPAGQIVSSAVQVSELRGAPLRTGLTGAVLSAPGLVVVGDAAGLTYPISGEGIGKAMESGILAAEIIRDNANESPETVAARYDEALRSRLSSRFEAYSGAQRWVAHPRMVDFLAWRANRGTYVMRQLEGLVNETAEPDAILSLRGVIRSLFS